MNEIIKTIIERRSIRCFSKKPLRREDFELIIQCGRHAPNSWNNQSYLLTVIQDRKIIRELAEITREFLNGPLEDYLFFGSSSLVIVSDKRDNPVHLADAGCVLENMFIAAQSMGIGSVWINQFSTLTEKEKVIQFFETLQIPRDYIVCGIGAFGYAGALPDKRELKSRVVYFMEEKNEPAH